MTYNFYTAAAGVLNIFYEHRAKMIRKVLMAPFILYDIDKFIYFHKILLLLLMLKCGVIGCIPIFTGLK